MPNCSPSPVQVPKVCTRCNIRKAPNAFHKDGRSSDGLRKDCKECRRTIEAARYARNADCIIEAQRSYRRDNADEINRRARARYANDPEPKRKAALKWLAANPEYGQAKHARRRGAKDATRLPRGYKAAMIAHYGDRCLACGRAGDLTFDHVKPLASGGAHSLANGQLLCFSCNSSKGARRATDYRDPELGILTGVSGERRSVVYPNAGLSATAD